MQNSADRERGPPLDPKLPPTPKINVQLSKRHQAQDYQDYYSSRAFFPATNVLAKLSKEVYNCRKWDHEPLKFQTPGLEGWSIVAVTPNYKRWKLLKWATMGYYGEAYFNQSTKQLVIAHKGTDNWRDFIADGWLAFNYMTHYNERAYNFSLNLIRRLGNKAVSVTITGHSLGGYLAQTTAFFLKLHEFKSKSPFPPRPNSKWVQDPDQWLSFGASNRFHVHVVAFDSPAAGKPLKDWMGTHSLKDTKSLRERNEFENNFISDLDITVYISKLNIINTCNGYYHLGRLFHMKNVEGRVGRLKWETHSLDRIVKYLDDPASLLVEVKVWKGRMRDIQPVENDSESVAADDTQSMTISDNNNDKAELRESRIDPTKYQWNVFTSAEKGFCESLQKCLDWERDGNSSTVYLKRTIDLRRYGLSKNSKFQILLKENLFCLDDAEQVERFICTVKFLSRFDSSLNYFEKVKAESEGLPGRGISLYLRRTKDYVAQFKKYELRWTNVVAESEFFKSFNEFLHPVTECNLRILVVKSKNPALVSAYLISILLNHPEGKFWNGSEAHPRICMCTLEKILDLNEIKVLDQIQDPGSSLELLVVDCSSVRNTEKISSILSICVGNGKRMVLILPPILNIASEINQDNAKFLEPILSLTHRSLSDEAFLDLNQGQVDFSQGTIFGSEVLLREIFDPVIFDSFEQLQHLFNLRLGRRLPKLTSGQESYYIERKFENVVLKYNASFFKKEENRNRNMFFVFSENFAVLSEPQLQDEYRLWLESENIPSHSKCFKMAEDSKHYSYENRNIHYLRLENGQCCWLRSNPISSAAELFTNQMVMVDEQFIPGDSIVETNFPLTLVIDEPGMGKSISMKKLAVKLKEKQPNRWIIFVDLGSNSIQLKGDGADMVLNFLSSVERLNKSSIEYSILKQLVKENRLVLFLDSFDEISVSNQSQIVEMCKFIISCPEVGIQIFIASREHASPMFDSVPNCRIRKFVPLDHKEQVDFLVNYFKNSENLGFDDDQIAERREFETSVKERGTEVEELCGTIIQKLEHIVGTDKYDKRLERFMGIPLSLYMLAVIHTEHFRNIILSSSELSDIQISEFKNVLSLYQSFVNVKYKIHYSKRGMDEEAQKEYSAEDRQNQLHCLKSLSYLSDKVVDYVAEFGNFEISFDEVNLINKTGLIWIQNSIDGSDSRTEFVHRTVAEYFAALCLFNRLKEGSEKTVQFLKKCYKTPSFGKVGQFLDLQLATHHKQSCTNPNCQFLDAIEGSLSESLQLTSEVELDLLGRTLLHYLGIYGDRKGRGIIDYILQLYEYEPYAAEFIIREDRLGRAFSQYAATNFEADWKYMKLRKFMDEDDEWRYRLWSDWIVFCGSGKGELNRVLLGVDKKVRILEASESSVGSLNLNVRTCDIRGLKYIHDHLFSRFNSEAFYELYTRVMDTGKDVSFLSKEFLAYVVRKKFHLEPPFNSHLTSAQCLDNEKYFIQKFTRAFAQFDSDERLARDLETILKEVPFHLFQCLFSIMRSLLLTWSEGLDLDLLGSESDHEALNIEPNIFPTCVLARFLMEGIQDENLSLFQIRNIYFNPTFICVRIFLDILLVNESQSRLLKPILTQKWEAVAEVEQATVEHCLDPTQTDLLGRGPLHYVANYGCEKAEVFLSLLKAVRNCRNEKDKFECRWPTYILGGPRESYFSSEQVEGISLLNVFLTQDDQRIIESGHEFDEYLDFIIEFMNEDIADDYELHYQNYKRLAHQQGKNEAGTHLTEYLSQAQVHRKNVVARAIQTVIDEI